MPKVNGSLQPRANTANAVAQQANKAMQNLGTNLPKHAQKVKNKPVMAPKYEVSSRMSPYLAMMIDPMGAQPALPPISLPARAICLKQFQEVLLSSDANGNCCMYVQPCMVSQYSLATAITGTTVTTMGAYSSNAEYTSFNTNFLHYIPLAVEVVLTYTGSINAVAGRMYGIVGGSGVNDLTKFPLEPTGCEAVTSDGISCTWYSTAPVWNNPIVASQNIQPAEWMDTLIKVGMVGGPLSAPNIITASIYFHLAGFPAGGICGLTPMASLSDPSVEYAAGLFALNEDGMGASSMSAKKRDKHRRTKAVIRDVLKIGGDIAGTVFPMYPGVNTAAHALSRMIK